MSSLANIFLDRTRRLRTVWRLLIFVVGFIALRLGLIVVAIIGLVILELALGRDASALGYSLDDQSLGLFYVVAIPSALLVLGLAIVCRRFLDRRSVRSMGFTRPEPRLSASTWVGLGLGALPIVAATAILLVTGGLTNQGFAGPWHPALMFPVLVVAAFNEELVCRGYMYRNFLDIRRPITGLIVTSTFFWLMHSLNSHVWSSPVIALNLFGAGVLLALAYQASGNIWFPTALHFAWNYAQALFGIPISGMEQTGLLKLAPSSAAPKWLTGGEFGLEGSVLATAGVVALIALFAWIIRKRRPPSVPITVVTAVPPFGEANASDRADIRPTVVDTEKPPPGLDALDG